VIYTIEGNYFIKNKSNNNNSTNVVKNAELL